MAGLFLVFEGIEGSGKSLQLKFMARHLRERGVEPVVTREPGGTPLGQGIRRLLLDDGDPSPLAELFLYLADRAQHVERVIRPARGMEGSSSVTVSTPPPLPIRAMEGDWI